MRTFATLFGVISLAGLAGVAHAGQPDANEIVAAGLEADPWGNGDAETKARAIVKEKDGATRTLVFHSRSRRYAPPLTKSIMFFEAPADLRGVGFLQIQKKGGDDDRNLYLPELGKSRRIAAKGRNGAFMGTDFSYADLDRRDLRESSATMKGEDTMGKHAVWVIEATPTADDAVYGRIDLWVRKDNNVPLKMEMFNKSGKKVKTMNAHELRRIEGAWFITRSTMQNHKENRSTELILDNIDPRTDIPNDEFTVRNLEK